MFKRLIVFLPVILVVIATSCASTSGLNMQPEEYFLSKHNPQNTLVYFFIEKSNSPGDFYTFFISDQLTEDQWMNCLVAFTTERNPYPEKWYNNYCPVVIQDDFNGISMAAFSFPQSINKIWILAQLINREGNEIKNNLFPRDFQINNNPVQYYLIKYNSGEFNITEINRSEMERQLNRTTSYAAQLGKKTQKGFIKGP